MNMVDHSLESLLPKLPFQVWVATQVPRPWSSTKKHVYSYNFTSISQIEKGDPSQERLWRKEFFPPMVVVTHSAHTAPDAFLFLF